MVCNFKNLLIQLLNYGISIICVNVEDLVNLVTAQMLKTRLMVWWHLLKIDLAENHTTVVHGSIEMQTEAFRFNWPTIPKNPFLTKPNRRIILPRHIYVEKMIFGTPAGLVQFRTIDGDVLAYLRGRDLLLCPNPFRQNCLSFLNFLK